MSGWRAVFVELPEPNYPTPVRAYPELGSAQAELWSKNDGLSHTVYGGNKVRKAVPLVREAMRRNARRVLSFGAAGSHHLLTLALFARAAGLESAAVLIPQPRTEHATQTLRASLGLGLEVYPARHSALVPLALARALRARDYVIPPGGSNAIGTSACADAIDELTQQIALGLLPLPDWIVVPLGSGGTCAGLAAGVVRRGLSCRVLAVQVVPGVGPRAAARYLAREALRRAGHGFRAPALESQLVFDISKIGAGYGHPSAAGANATEVARGLGLELDPTYTAKAFASVLELLTGELRLGAMPPGRPLRVLYWHTLAATNLAPLLVAAPNVEGLPTSLSRLLR
jgi:1-aminocyclopropane-1-carboxylate deaminase/D-cysteine desulfhydrase-like pyridoxal-dependent ACC family enzyme